MPCAVVNSPEYISYCLGDGVTNWTSGTGKSEATLYSKTVFFLI
jgi:hypothetical protein